MSKILYPSLRLGYGRCAGAVDRFVGQNPQHNGPALIGD